MAIDPKDGDGTLTPDPSWLAHIDDERNDAGDEAVPPRTERRRGLRVIRSDSFTIAEPEARHRADLKIGPDIDRMTDEAVRALASDRDTYERGGSLVHVAHVALDERSPRLPTGSPAIRLMGRATLRERLSRAARWIRFDGRSQSWRETTPDERAVAAAHERGAWPGVAPLVGVSETPFMRADGTIVQTPGYDAASGYLYLPTDRFTRIDEAPSVDDARDALAMLAAAYAEFPFASDAARAVPIAAILTVLARPAIDGSIPAFVIEASTAGTGKTLIADTVATITTGRDAARTTYPTDPEELRKVLDGFAIDGARLVVIDNVPTSRPLGGAALDAFITARDAVAIRELGRTGNRTVPWRATLLATGNNLTYGGDTVRRVLVSRLDANVERPEAREGFSIPHLVAHVRNARPRLVVAALTVLRAYVAAGRPDMKLGGWGSFSEWAALVPPAIVLAGGANPLGARIAGDGEHDPERHALATLIAHLPRLDERGRGLAVREIVAALYPGGRVPGPESAPDGLDDLRDALEHLAPTKGGLAPNTTILAGRFRALRNVVVAGRRLASVAGRANAVRWLVEAVEPPQPRETSSGAEPRSGEGGDLG